MPYAFPWLILPDLQGSVKRGKGYACLYHVLQTHALVCAVHHNITLSWQKTV